MSGMSHPLLSVSAQQRLNETLKAIKEHETLWILTDEHGCVMLTADDEDGIPVWPDAGIASLWATDDWSHCEPLQISLADWFKKWVPGMKEDELLVMVCPVPGEEGEVMEPAEFAEQLS